MPHMLLMVEPVGQRSTRTVAEGEAAYASMVRFGEDLKARGLLLASESLQSTANAVRVNISGGRAHVLDGPFAEAKEMVGGFFLLATESRAEAVEIAKQCPAAQWLTVEVRGIGTCSDEAQGGAQQ